MRSTIDLHLIEGDVLSAACDLACFKHAQAFYGADEVAVSAIANRAGRSWNDFEVPIGEVRSFETLGAMTAPRAAFFGTDRLGTLRYHELRLLAGRMLSFAQTQPSVKRIATTVHGVRAGLDEQEAVLALVGGFIDAFQKGAGGDIEEVAIVERNSGRARRMRQTLEDGLAKTSGVTKLASGAFRVERSVAFKQATVMATAGQATQEKPHAFVAMPFLPELEDVFHYGIQAPVKSAGLLCERVDQVAFDGLIIQRIRERIETAKVVIADLSTANPNVYLEVGYAWGRNKPTILLVRDVSELRFDVQGHRCLIYRSIRELESLLLLYSTLNTYTHTECINAVSHGSYDTCFYFPYGQVKVTPGGLWAVSNTSNQPYGTGNTEQRQFAVFARFAAGEVPVATFGNQTWSVRW